MPDRAAYFRDYRTGNPAYRARDAARKAARARALERLARAHPAEFLRFYYEERQVSHA